ncbi:LOW QUALITY PROTEIN: stress enhanced protein 2, chloroplastic [Dioscorea cayenensis subsp. rotundata]|uniref:LOW QUALITY PROTEIN: stress enhanced protein 2, chloroplastic n=1 Tax=Dioscorea cayennensis subsp. rotundata TaxID=55577 RepID=A0AB40D5D1_DIOCR|nr:LOW QUALITY PROTEIN: stress enhanced protein 2, chloroplastic [Dioscorea cayenensis subsp. rotundata]
MAMAARAIYCELSPTRSSSPSSPRRDPTPSAPAAAVLPGRRSVESGKIVLQPRLCTLRSYGSESRNGVVRAPLGGGDGGGGGVSPFFTSLAEYIESSRKSHDFEIVSGRLAMVAFAAAVAVESVTGNSLFKKLDLQQIEEAGGVCLVVIASAATFALFSSNRKRIRQMFTLSCNSLVDSLLDNLIDGLFYEGAPTDWSDD